MQVKVLSHSEEETVATAQEIAMMLTGGEVFLLESDLGGGKTAFCRGLAKGLQSSDAVSSPTFVISHVYQGRLELHHYDLYRLGELGLMSEELREVLDEGTAVVAIEWPQLASGAFPPTRTLRINFQRQKTAEDDRLLVFDYPDSLEYLFNTIKERLC